jgi:hypothetical protein
MATVELAQLPGGRVNTSSSGNRFNPGRLKNIGNTLMMPTRVDALHRVSKYQRRNMRVVDLIPADFNLLANQLTNLTKIAEGNFKGEVLKYEYIDAIEKFRRICNNYGINDSNVLSGVRLWLTDETASNESFTNNYTTNLIEQAINNLGTKWKQLSQIHKSIKSTSSQRGFDALFTQGRLDAIDIQTRLNLLRIREDTIENQEEIKKLESELQAIRKDPRRGTISNTLSDLSGLLGIANDSALTSILRGVFGVLGRGETFNLPKIWENSDYAPTMSLTIKLVSPYGSPKAIKKFIVEPLLCLLILAAPKSSNNITISRPTPLRIKTYGINNINFGSVRNIQIRRGGGNITYNKYRQPLSLDLSLQIEPLFHGFASLIDDYDLTVDEFDRDVSGQGDFDDTKSSRSFTTIGDVIKSFRPFTQEVNEKNYQSGREYKDGVFDRDNLGINEHYARTQPMQTFTEQKGQYIPSIEFSPNTPQIQSAPNNESGAAIANSLDDKKIIFGS